MSETQLPPTSPRTKRGRFRWLLTLVRVAICVAAIAFLVHTVDLHDHVILEDESKVRLLEQRGDEFVVARAGREEVLAADQIDRLEDGTAKIQYGIGSVVKRTDATMALWAVLTM